MMDTPKVFESEYRFCQILWENEPITTTELVRLCRQRLEWKKSTTYTVIRRLADRGVVRLDHSVVTSLVSRDQVGRSEGRQLLDRAFGGSLPQFIAAFASGGDLTDQEAEEIRRLIDQYQEDRHG